MEELLVKVLQYYIAMYNLWKCVLNFTISFCVLTFTNITHYGRRHIQVNTEYRYWNKSNVTRCKVG